MKKTYQKPTMTSQLFAANEYVAACGSQPVYLFNCNAGEEDKHYRIFLNGEDGVPFTADDIDYSKDYANGRRFIQCGKQHYASTDSIFQLGYLRPQPERNKPCDMNNRHAVQAYIWLEDRPGDRIHVHATSNLELDTWEVAKS